MNTPYPVLQLFDYPEIEQVNTPNGRHYICPLTGDKLPSVTTILSATSENKEWLKEWEERVGFTEAERVRKEASDLGTLVHLHLELYLKGEDRPKGSSLQRMLAARMADKVISDGLPGIDEVWGNEVRLYFPSAYAGTTDIVGRYKGRPAIMDFKTTKMMKDRTDISDYLDQMSAYCAAHGEIYGTDIDYGVIFMVARDLKFEVYEFDAPEIRKHTVSFMNRVEKFYEMNPYFQD